MAARREWSVLDMRMIFGVVSLLVALAAVGVLVRQQLRTVAAVPAAASNTPGEASTDSGTPAAPGAALQQEVRDDVNRLLQQGAARAASEAE